MMTLTVYDVLRDKAVGEHAAVGPPRGPPPHDQPPPEQPPVVQPPGVQPPEVQPPGVQPPGVQPPGVQPPGVQPPGVQPPGVQPPGVQPPGVQPPEVQPPGVQHPVAEPKKAVEKWGGLTDLLGASSPPVPVATPPLEPAKIDPKGPRVFISHCKNKNILRQIKQMLDQGKVDRVISEEKETAATPLSDRVSDLMWECNCAIINISADDEKKEEETLEINENVIAEVWGAYLHYK